MMQFLPIAYLIFLVGICIATFEIAYELRKMAAGHDARQAELLRISNSLASIAVCQTEQVKIDSGAAAQQKWRA